VPFGTSGAVDTTVPTLFLSPDPGDGRSPVQANSVSATSNGQVFYTTDGSPAVSGDAPADNAQLYTGPIRISAPTDVNVAAFDQVGNLVLASGRYTPVTVGLPAAPTGLAAGAATQTSVPLTWDAGPASVTGYQVTVYDADGARLTAQPAATAAPRQTVADLRPGTTYRFTVAAKNAAGTGPDSAPVSATTAAPTDKIAITSARWKPDDFRVLGTGSVVGSQMQAYRANADGSIGAAIAGASARVVAAAPPGIGAFTIRLRDDKTPATNPGRVFVKSSGGGVAGPFTVPNG
jgi:Fibronectin type III domain/Chitobiase/beta-hexosaminidase C-terminal domain